MSDDHGKSADPSAIELLDRRAELLGRGTRGGAELAELTDALRVRLAGPGTVRRLSIDTGGDEERLARELARTEPVNAVRSEADLRDRFDRDRRVFVLEHPSLPDRPMNVVWVALRRGHATRLADVLDPSAAVDDPDEADTAVFYSIWNAQPGLVGLGGGSELLEATMVQLCDELPGLETFMTLSPVPGLRRWLTGHGHEDSAEPPELARLCATYLTSRSDRGRLLDPVARFHLGNGARLYALCPNADPSTAGVQRSWQMMANYRYAPEDRAANRAALGAGEPVLGDSLARAARTRRKQTFGIGWSVRAPESAVRRVPRSSDGANVQGFGALASGADLELDRLALFEGLVALARDVGEVDEDVFLSLTRDEAVALLVVEELDGSVGDTHCACFLSSP